MSINRWGNTDLSNSVIDASAGSQLAPAVADNGGTEFGVAWIDNNSIFASFFDEMGRPNPALPSVVLTDGVGTGIKDVQMAVGGTGIGYGAIWEETNAGLSQVHLRYVGLGALVGGEIAVSSNPGIDQHDASISAYTQDDANGRPNVDGFDVAWVEGAGGTHALGNVYVQRFAVPLDAKKDPAGPPVAAGMDGNPATGISAQVLISNSGRDPSVAGLLGAANETVVTWIDASNRINIKVYNDNGAVNNNNIGAATNNLNTAAAALSATSQQHVIALAGGGFVVVWTATAGANNFLAARVFTPGAAAGTFTASVVTLLDNLDGASNAIADFTLAALPDSGGFSVTWTALDDPDGAGALAATQAIHTRSFSAGGVPQELVPSIFHAPADAIAAAAAGLIGDRYVVVYQDNSTPGDASNIGAQIFDTRLDPIGDPIVLNGPGLTLIGDPEFETRGRVAPDVLVGTIGQDTIDGRQADDILDGALGDDTIIAGGGNDAIDGGGGNDTLVLTGRFTQDGDASNDDYVITSEGNGIFTIVDKRANADGADTVRGIENFQFLGSGNTLTAAQLSGEAPNVTPTAWGWSNADADTAPDAGGSPDVDGFVVNHAPTSLAGVQTNPFVADSVGEFVGVVWETTTAPGAETHIRGQFYDVIGAPDSFIPNAIDISDGIGIETNPVIVSGGANSGWGAVWEQRDNATDVSHELRTNFVGPGQLTSVELSVLNEGALVDQHDAAMSGSFLDRTLASPVGGSVLPTGMNEGYNIAWVSTHLDGSDGALPTGYGHIMLQRFEVPLDPLGNPGAPVAGGIDGIANLDNAYNTGDAAVWVGDEDANGAGGAFGRNPSTAALHTFETGIVWIAQDGTGEKVSFRAYDDLGQVISFAGGDNISVGYPVAAGTDAHIVSAGAVNFVVAWITADASSPSGFSVMGTMLSSAGNGLNGAGFGFGAPSAPFVLTQLPAGFDPAAADFQLTGISGEDSSDVIVSWILGGDVEARHIRTTLDPVTGIALSMTPEGDVITVNAATAGAQDQASIAGMLGDRFIAVYHDTNGSYTDGNDIVARIIDTRDAVNPDPIIGDLVRPDGGIQARRDVLIGTNGNDDIRGDISDSNGLVDYIFAGMGDDVIQGGPGLRGAAGIPEMIDGGEGNDTAVYTGRLQDYSITINGDGSYEVIDLRPTQGANNTLLTHDGIDNLYNIENIRFLDLANGGAGAQTITFGFPGTPPTPPVGYDGTPVVWSLDDPSAFKEIAVDQSTGTQSGIAVTNLQDGAALSWVSDNNQVWAITYDTTGKSDPILLGANTQLTDGTFSGNTVSDIDVAMTGGLGMTAVWESANAGDSSIHLRFASTNTHVVLDPAGGVPGPGLPGGELVVVGSDGDGTAVDPVIQGYEIVNVDNDTLEVGFHVGFVMQGGVGDTTAADAYGTLEVARYEIPVYDILVDAAGLPILDVNNQGQLATDAFGNPIPSTAATFGTGSETAPISIGLDGLRGTADDAFAIILTDLGLRAANNLAGATPIQGRDISIGSLHDGQLVVSYIGTDEQVHLKVFIPTVNEIGDRETGGTGTDVVATGITTYAELDVPFPETLGAVAPGQTAYLVPQQNGSFGVFWAAAGAVASTIDIKGIIYAGAGTNWSSSPVITFEGGLAANVAFQIAPTGVTPGGLEDGFFVSWESGSGIQGQRFDMTGALVGAQITVGDPTSGTPGLHSTAGIDDGRMIVGYQDGADVSAQFLDNREPGIAIIGPRTGAPADVLVGTVGDDAMDGRALDDQLFGGLGNDLITLGSGNDQGFGGLGNDTIIGGSGQDQLFGEDGDDLLWGGSDGTPDPQIERDLPANLQGPGIDLISGGAGTDTISYRGEFGRFDIDLTRGTTLSDRTGSGVFTAEDAIGQLVTDAAGLTTLSFTHDVENVEGGLGNDIIGGDAGANIISGLGGNDFIDGRGGIDRAKYSGNRSDYLLTFNLDGTVTVADQRAGAPDGTDTVRNVEFLDFADISIPVAPPTNTPPVIISNNGGATAAISIAENTTAVTDVNATEPDAGQTLTYSIAGGADAAKFTVNAASGVVAFVAAPDFEAPTDSGGNNVYDVVVQVSDGNGGFDTQAIAVTVTNVAGVTVTSNAATITGTAEEDALTGQGGANTLNGLAGNDLLTGGAGNDTLNGGAGVDTMIGNTGNDTFIVDNIGDVVVESVGEGTDTIQTVLNSFSLSAIANVENLAFTGAGDFVGAGNTLGNAITGGNGNDTLTGDAGNDTLNGGGGNDSLDGGTGADAMAGGAGNDTYVVDNVGDVVTEGANAGTDLVQTILNAYTLTTNVENLTFLGAGNFNGTGNTANNVITGGGGNDTLNGGAGNDTLVGGTGDDTYVVDSAGDIVTEGLGGGTDTVSSSVAYTLGANVENLALTGVGNIAGTGNELANILTGNGGNNSLSGGGGDDTLIGNAGNDILNGGTGADTMAGGAGNDTYVIDDGGDVVTEAGNAGTDLVQTGLSAYTLGINLESLTFTGATDFTGTGNTLANIITGGTGNDTLSGGGGNDTLNGGGGNDTLNGDTGADTLVGGTGNDTYVVDNVGDVVTEATNAGTDLVQTTLGTYTLSTNVDNLSFSGAGNFNGTGNALNNIMTGGTGNDTLNGGDGSDTLNGGGGVDTLNGGAGNDRMIGEVGNDIMNGGAGNDTFVFAAGFGNDIISGFDANAANGQDLLDLTALNVNAANFAASVQITDLGNDMLITIGGNSITLLGVNGVGTNSITQQDFLLA
jgi:Ca2+-binding RTX toxin-like protein